MLKVKESLIKYGASDAQSDFSSAYIKTTQAYFVYGKEFLCKVRKICKQMTCQAESGI